MTNDAELESGALEQRHVPNDDFSLAEIRPKESWRPSFVWLAVDAVCLLAVGLSCLLFKLVGVPYNRGFYCDDDSINKPYKESTVPSSVMYPVGFSLAYLVVLATELYHFNVSKQTEGNLGGACFKVGSIKFNSLTIRLFSLFITFAFGAFTTILLTDIGKYTVGRLRPHFLSICRLDPAVLVNCTNKYITDDVCMGHPGLLREGRLSFPSGHASFSAYAAMFIIFYVESKVQFSHSKFLKFFVQLVAAQLGILCALSRVSDYKHHWSDVLAGLLLGALTAAITIYRVLNFSQKNISRVRKNVQSI